LEGRKTDVSQSATHKRTFVDDVIEADAIMAEAAARQQGMQSDVWRQRLASGMASQTAARFA
jgi:hypothetical protein